MQKYKNIIIFISFIIIWQLSKFLGFLPKYIIPSPFEIILSFIKNYKLLFIHTLYTISETFIGIFISIIFSCIISILMDKFQFIFDIIYPIIIVLQTIPTIALAPILVLWLGYNLTPKIILITLTTSFPLIINILDGFKNCDKDYITLLKLMNANDLQIYIHFKIPYTTPYFFSGLKISISYAFISAVVSEWLGGFKGLGVYMIQSKKLFQYDTMFAIIILISFISILSVNFVSSLEKKCLKWKG